MHKNINRQEVIGYLDEYGFLYCEKHSSPGMEAVLNGEENGTCKICNKIIGENQNDL